MKYDQAILVCAKCHARHTTFLAPALSGKELPAWLKQNVIKFCDCDATHCDVMFRIQKGAA